MKIFKNFSLRPYNTFGIDAYAEEFAEVNNQQDLLEILSERNGSSLMFLGGGSNILLTGNVEGVVIKVNIGDISRENEDDEHVYLKVGAGVNWHSFVLYCLENNLAGVENLALIPGSVGASPMQNIGAYGVEIKDVFHKLSAIGLNDFHQREFNLDECAFGYRESVFKKNLKGRYVITDVTFRLNKAHVYNTSYGAIESELEKMNADISIQNIAEAVMRIRRSKLPDPQQIGNAGSFFKNPQIDSSKHVVLKTSFPDLVSFPFKDGYKLAAAWLIEQCGWKGYRDGDAGCHALQPLVLVNYGNATGRQILDISNRIIESVYNKFGVELEREVNLY